MRTFEAILILVNLLALGLSIKHQSKKVWLGAAGLNLILFFLHCIVEGVRYHMIFSYLFVVLLAILAWTEIKIPRVLKVMTVSLSVVLLLCTAFLAYAFPVFRLPRPTGSYPVGFQYFHLIDESRADPFLAQSTQERELMIKVYYPAAQDHTKPFSAYFHNSRQLLQALTTGYGMPGFVFEHLTLVKTHAKEHLELSGQQPTYPIILFSHGAGTTMEVQTSQSEDLASHGYIVVDIDHTYVSAATVFPDRIISHHEATTDFNTPEPAEIITQIMADDASFVVDTLGEMNEGKIESIFTGKLDLENIGAIGHSVGGAVAYHLAIHDSRVKAAIDLDGIVFITPKGDPNALPPFLMLASDPYHVQALESRKPLMKKFDDMDDLDKKITIEIHGSQEVYDEAYNRAQQNVIGLTEVLKSSGDLFTIEGSDHMKFTDIGLFIGNQQLRESINIRGKTDPARCLEITEAVTLAFFDRHLKDETTSFEVLIQRYPELRQVELK